MGIILTVEERVKFYTDIIDLLDGHESRGNDLNTITLFAFREQMRRYVKETEVKLYKY